MLCTTTRSLLTPTPTLTRLPHRHHLLRRTYNRTNSLSTTTTNIKMSSSSQTIEHIVLFNVKPATNSTQLAAMVNGLNNLRSLDTVLHLTSGPLHRNRSSSPLNFTHILHSRYRTKEDLANYSAHDAHLSVVRSSVLPICDDIMAVDWVAENDAESADIKSGSAMRFQFVKLKDGVGEKEKSEVFDVIRGLTGKLGVEQVSYGENFSPARAKGFSIAAVGVFKGVAELDALEADAEIEKGKEKVREYVDDLIVVDYVVPEVQSSSNL